MERLKSIKNSLLSCVEGQMGNLQQADAKELGEAIDMIKDLEEAIYYKTITEAMEEKEHEPKYYTMPTIKYNRDMERGKGRMYYDGMYNYANSNGGSSSSSSSGNGGSSSGGSRNYQEVGYPLEIMRDHREGRSPSSRKMYMEAKETHQDKAKQMRELDRYMQELSHDVTEMIHGSSPEEKQYLEKKLNELSSKISQLK